MQPHFGGKSVPLGIAPPPSPISWGSRSPSVPGRRQLGVKQAWRTRELLTCHGHVAGGSALIESGRDGVGCQLHNFGQFRLPYFWRHRLAARLLAEMARHKEGCGCSVANVKTNLAEVEERGGEIAVTLQAACNFIQNVLINTIF